MTYPTPIEILQKLVDIPSPYPFENPLAEHIQRLLGQWDFQVHRIYTDTRFNVAAEKGSGPTLLLLGHLDTVPIQGAENLNPHLPKDRDEIVRVAHQMGWIHDPYHHWIDESRIYGSGTIDMKAGIAGIIYVAANLPTSWFQSHRLKILFTIDEEYVDKGMYAAIQSDFLSNVEVCISTEILDTTEYAIKGETADFDTILLGRRGRCALELLVFGKAAHGATPQAGINAIEEMARLISFVKKGIETHQIPLRSHAILPPATMTFLQISGGTSSLSIPGSCSVILDRHMVPPETIPSVIQELTDYIHTLDPPIRFTLELLSRPTDFLLPFYTQMDHPFITHIKSIYAHQQVPIHFTGGNSVADENMVASAEYTTPWKKAIPTVVIGCKGGAFHQPNEYAEISSFQRFCSLLFEICSFWNPSIS